MNVIENILNTIPEILECCVVKSPHPSNVSEASCHIVLRPECWNGNIDIIIQDIIRFVEIETSKMYFYYIPGTYEFRRERLPMTPFGKINFRQLEEENAQQYKKIRV